MRPKKTLTEIKKNRDQAYAYLRGGNALGATPAELLIEAAANGLEDDGGPDCVGGIVDAIANITQSMKLLLLAHGELHAALARHQERLDTRVRQQATRKRRK